MTRFAYDRDLTVEEYKAAIAEAYQQADGLSEHSERLRAEADRWYDRAYTLEMDLEHLLWALELDNNV